MATCNNTSIIFPSECIGESLAKINTNFNNLDTGLCDLSDTVTNLAIKVANLAVVDTDTIDMTFVTQGLNSLYEFGLDRYSLFASVRDNSLGTSKLGVDIPQSTKVFLTAAKIDSLIDVAITAPITNDQVIRWNGSQWTNQNIFEFISLNDLSDVVINTPIDQQVLKYNAATSQWENLPDGGLRTVSVVGNNLSTGGTNTAGVYGTANAVYDDSDLYNIKQDFTLNFKRLKGAGATQISETENEITIDVPVVTLPADQQGVSLGTGTAIAVYAGMSGRNLQFRGIKAGANTQIQQTPSEIIITSIQPSISIPDIPAAPTGSNIGDTENVGDVFASVEGSNLRFRRIKGGNNITVSTIGDNVVINGQAGGGEGGTSYSIGNEGTTSDGAGVAGTTLPTELKVKRIKGTGILNFTESGPSVVADLTPIVYKSESKLCYTFNTSRRAEASTYLVEQWLPVYSNSSRVPIEITIPAQTRQRLAFLTSKLHVRFIDSPYSMWSRIVQTAPSFQVLGITSSEGFVAYSHGRSDYIHYTTVIQPNTVYTFQLQLYVVADNQGGGGRVQINGWHVRDGQGINRNVVTNINLVDLQAINLNGDPGTENSSYLQAALL